MLLLPSAAATWRSQGQAEPDTSCDASGGFAWQEPPTGAPRPVCFNAFELVSLGAYDPCAFEGQQVRDAECGGMPAYAAKPGILPVAGAKVWGDRGVPGASGYEGCNVQPVARGTGSRTGKMIRYVDCDDGTLVAGTPASASLASLSERGTCA
jgi:hypothetical protein